MALQRRILFTLPLLLFYGSLLYFGIKGIPVIGGKLSPLAVMMGTILSWTLLACLWGGPICEKISGLFVSELFDAGGKAKARPRFAMIESRIKQGKFKEALDLIRQETNRFPEELDLYIKEAEVHAQGLLDPSTAIHLLERVCNDPAHKGPKLIGIFNLLADLHLKFHQDAEAARQALEQIALWFPNTPAAQVAIQRVAHLGQAGQFIDSESHDAVHLSAGPKDLGLHPEQLQPKIEDSAGEALRLENHLQQHPLDTEARVRLAILLFEELGEPRRAVSHYEFLLSLENQPSQRMVEWHHQLADLHALHLGDPIAAEGVLNQLMEKHPGSSIADNARNRVLFMKLEARKQQSKTPVPMKEFEKDLGLKLGYRPRINSGADE